MNAAMAVGALVVVLIAAVALFRRRDTGYDVDKFERARSLTTEWARRAEGPAPSEAGRADAQSLPRDGDRPAE
jgi:hypothetical protein